jgi:hypothetical protein
MSENTIALNPNAVTGPQYCRECASVHERCVCDWCHAGPPPQEPYCESCDRHHPAGDLHCPNCGQPASSGFHASWSLDECPVWEEGRWVPILEAKTKTYWVGGNDALDRLAAKEVA